MVSIGQSVGSYRIERALGEGGMGKVFEAVQVEIGKRVAIKTLHAGLSQQAENVGRFLNEARAVNVIGHPSLVTIFDHGKLPDGTVYIVMEYLQGESLAQRIEGGSLTISDTMRLGRQIASALQAAHDKNIIHRDLKPDNVMIVADPEAAAGERAKILDFGIAKLTDDLQGTASLVKTQAGTVLGTPLYMSPEQCDGAPIDARSDVYSLGIILYEMLTGSPPFVARAVSALMLKHVSATPQPLRERNPLCPEGLAALVHRMLEKSATARPSMADVARELDRLLAERPRASETPVGRPPPPEPREPAPTLPGGELPAEPPLVTDEALGPPMRSAPAVPLVATSLASAPLERAPAVRAAVRARRLPWIVAGIGLVLLAGVLATLLLWPRRVRLVVEIAGDIGAGSVTSDPFGIDCGDRCTGSFRKGRPLWLTATPAPHYIFAGWSGPCEGTGVCRLQPDAETRVEAHFTRDTGTTPSGRPAATPPYQPHRRPPAARPR